MEDQTRYKQKRKKHRDRTMQNDKQVPSSLPASSIIRKTF